MKIWSVLEPKEKKSFIFFISLIAVTALVELLGIGLILPFTSMIMNDSSNIFPNFFNFDFVINLEKKLLIYYFCLTLLIIFLLKNVYLGFFYFYEGVFLNSTIHNISTRIFKKILDNQLVSKQEFHSSQIINDLTKEITMFGNYLSAVVIMITEIPIVILISSFIFIYQTQLVLFILLIILLATFVYLFFVGKKIRELGRSRKLNEEEKLKYLQEGLYGIKEIQLYGKEDHFIEKFRAKSEKISKNFYAYNFFSKAPRLFFEFLFVAIITTLMAYFNYYKVEPGEFIPLLALFLVASFRILPGVNRIVGSFQQIAYTKVAMNTIHSKLSQVQFKTDNQRKEFFIKKNILLKDLSFNYKDKEPVIKNLSENIVKGDIVGVYGPSGAGKSTLLDIITGVKEPTKGGILYDDKHLTDFQNKLFKNISYIPQSVFLFDDTIKNNITFYTKNFNNKKFHEAIKIAKLESYVKKLPNKEETIVGEVGKKISGGEKQRIGLARAIYHNPDILILDEATSAIDKNTEKEIFINLQNYVQKDKILIFVSHKESLLDFSNKTIRIIN
jgi:ABC-type multidrug transport system fused ATPase/permease subunit